MKIFLLCTFLTTQVIQGYAQTIQWSKSEPLAGNVVYTNCIANDKNGNVIVAGKINQGGGIYVLKYDEQGNKLWENNYMGSHTINNVIVDTAGNSYVLILGSLTINGTVYNHRALTVKYDSNGSVVWVKDTPGAMGFSKISSAQGKGFYGAGTFADTVILENNVVLIDTTGNGTTFLGYFDNDGNCQWAFANEGSQTTKIYSPNDSVVFVSGYFFNTVKLGQGINQVTLYQQNGNSYIAKYTSSGEFIWAKQIRTNLWTADKESTLYTCEQDSAYDRTLSTTRYNYQGIQLWERTEVNLGDWYKGQMTHDKTGNLYISGGFLDYLSVGDTTIQGSPNHYQFFLIKLDSSGTLKWTITSTGSGGAGAKAISVGDDNNIYITGDMQGQVSFGGYTLNEPNGGIFTLKISDDEVLASVPAIKKKSLFNIYPNPSSNTVFLYYNSSTESILNLAVKNQLGQLLITKKYPGQKELNETIDMSSFAKGIYFIELSSSDAIEVKKVVIE